MLCVPPCPRTTPRRRSLNVTPLLRLLPPSPLCPLQRRIQRAMDISSKHTPLPREQWEDPWREFEVVNKVLAQTQKEHDERLAMNNKWWMPYHIGRESWFPYDTKNAHFWKR